MVFLVPSLWAHPRPRTLRARRLASIALRCVSAPTLTAPTVLQCPQAVRSCARHSRTHRKLCLLACRSCRWTPRMMFGASSSGCCTAQTTTSRRRPPHHMSARNTAPKILTMARPFCGWTGQMPNSAQPTQRAGSLRMEYRPRWWQTGRMQWPAAC